MVSSFSDLVRTLSACLIVFFFFVLCQALKKIEGSQKVLEYCQSPYCGFPVLKLNEKQFLVYILKKHDDREIFVNGVKYDGINTGSGNFTTITYDSSSGMIGRWDATVSAGNNYFFNGNLEF